MSQAGEAPKKRIAAALRYDTHNQEERVPRVSEVASGRNAERLLKLAREHHVPVHRDPKLAELLSHLDIGNAIPEELYLLVAEVIVFLHELDGRLQAEEQAPQPAPEPAAQGSYEPIYPPGFFDLPSASALPRAQDTPRHR